MTGEESNSQNMDVATDEIPVVGKEQVAAHTTSPKASDKMMDIDDPDVDDGSGINHDNGITTNVTIAEEEEARQAIEMLRGDDMSARVAAASKLENVAAALGEERTRKVSTQRCNIIHSPHTYILLYIVHSLCIYCLAFLGTFTILNGRSR